MQSQPKRRISKFFSHAKKKKNKTRQHTGDTDRKENDTNDKFNMKVQFDTDTRTDKNRQCITTCIKHLSVSGLSSISARIISSCNLIGNRFEMPNVSYTQPLQTIKKKTEQ